MVRIVIAALFSLLLVGMQREVLVHEVDHLRAKVAVGHDKIAQNVAAGECLECALLASGGSAAPPAPSAFVWTAHVGSNVPRATFVQPDVSRPALYRSRAPPVLL